MDIWVLDFCKKIYILIIINLCREGRDTTQPFKNFPKIFLSLYVYEF